MPNAPKVIAGFVYLHGTTTPVSDVVITVTNINNHESHSGGEDDFLELTTNAQGEFSCNLANFTEYYTIGDILEFTFNNNGLRDKIQYTIDATQNINIILNACSREIYDYERAIDSVGCKIKLWNTSRTLDDDYESIATETTILHAIQDNTYASIQLTNDRQEQREEGIIETGEANGFFKIRYNISKNDKIEFPLNSGKYWKVVDRTRHYYKDGAHHDEALLRRV